MTTQYDPWDIFFWGMAKYAAQKSKDPSTKVGAVIVRPDRTVASIGFNGFPRGMDDAPTIYADREVKYSRIIHAEMNALLFAREPVKGYTLYTSGWAPCDRCAVHLIQAGIYRFVFPPVPDDKKERWAAGVERTKQYFEEAGCVWDEIPLEVLSGGL